ncbi:hypothetical protein DACRYDRAFT_20825 [Dacryopinax primogenitus]|uniref:Uncharacterized protein n=1 Tax=Dacryopinax primogenitus (strain DJM 731) TaxID=1858805 RepID=M5G214_DACPD|nr:uncharacterized protein DACRYDRAFT_20825 [Dacryopinax primogenitus]EJU04226.1 hypothetical protein DACRYDRAFT_20825 [Dacryopinax primogenitus]
MNPDIDLVQESWSPMNKHQARLKSTLSPQHLTMSEMFARTGLDRRCLSPSSKTRDC